MGGPRLLILCVVALASALLPIRPPATPLIVFDPYMSIWSAADNLTDTLTTHWSGKITNLVGIIKIDQSAFVFMGRDTWSSSNAVPPMQQTRLTVHPTQTVYQFQQNGIELTLTFSTPAIMTNLKMWSLPTTYITYKVKSVDGKSHNVKIFYSHTGEIAVNDVNEEVTWSRPTSEGLTVLSMGSQAQKVLGQSGDAIKINWGYAYIAGQSSDRLTSALGPWNEVSRAFVQGIAFPPDDTNKPRRASNNWPVAALAYDFGSVSSTSQSTFFVFAYDDVKSIDYFGKPLTPYWKNFATTNQLIRNSFQSYHSIKKELDEFDKALEHNLTVVGGPKYATVVSLAYRQVTGATKIVKHPSQNRPWIFMKEISSDGDVSTVDVIFPAAPQFIYYNVEALKLLLEPVMEYANNKTNIKYNLAWAPHHLGTWPICDLTPEKQEQMPIEETGNLLMMLAYIAQAQNSTDFLKPYWTLIKSWGHFLVSSLPDPSKQLCTDDFEGPTPHNVNLAIKGVVGLKCLANILQMAGDPDAQGFGYRAAAFAVYVVQHSFSKTTQDHLIRQYDIPNSWSLKYNLLYDKLLPTNGRTMFPQEVYEIESAFYQTKLNRYGVPLDERATFMLLEYMGAIQALSTDESQNQRLNDAVFNWINEGPDRVPMSDWFDSITGKVVGFRARPTVGELFTRMILNKLQ